MDRDERSESGAPIYRHDRTRAKSEMVGAGSMTSELIQQHAQRYVGKVDNIFHEIVSDLIHVDINIVPPSPKRPYHTLITSGMSDRKMSTPQGREDMSYAELVISLPPHWQLKGKSSEDEAYYWPIRWLKILARLPHQYGTWLWATHTVPNGDPPEPFASNIKLCCALLLFPILMPKGFNILKVNDEKTIHFLSFVPIYREEMDFKLQQGLDPLMDRLDKAGVTELLNISRPNVCV